MWCVFFFFKQKTAYEMRISDWSSDVCSSDLLSRSLTRGGLDRSRAPRDAVVQPVLHCGCDVGGRSGLAPHAVVPDVNHDQPRPRRLSALRADLGDPSTKLASPVPSPRFGIAAGHTCRCARRHAEGTRVNAAKIGRAHV